MRDDGAMQCEVAREALSARIDGEREPVPATRVEEHLKTCQECCAWYVHADEHARRLRIHTARAGHDMSPSILMSAGIERVGRSQRWSVWLRRLGVRYALIGVGMIQLAVAAAQMGGADFGMLAMTAHQPGATSGAHLMNETTAWSLALGVGMIVTGAWPAAAAGVVSILGIFVAVLSWYVVEDAMAGRVTDIRMLSHLPVVVGAVLAVAVYRTAREDRRTPPAMCDVDDQDIVLPANARRGRRRGHLRSSTDSAA
jgi:RNA polymerase sigma-70 factor (ECF subfamily)